jgi:hypothetical protein
MIRDLSMVAREQEADGRTLAGATLPRPVSGSLRTSCHPGPIARTSEELKSTQLVEQRLGVLEVGGVEALGEPTVDWGEQVVGLPPLALLGPQPREASCRSEFEGFRTLISRDFDGPLKMAFSVRSALEP